MLSYLTGGWFGSYKPCSAPERPIVWQTSPASVFLEWTKPSTIAKNGCITGYKINVSESTLDVWNEAFCTKSDEVRAELQDFNPGVRYRFKVVAVCGKSGESDESEESEDILTALPCSPPGKPKVSQLTSTSASVEWDIPPEVGRGITIKRYEVQYVNSDSKDCTNIFSSAGDGTKMEIHNLSRKSRYVFTVSAICNKGASAQSQQSDILTLKERPKDVLVESSLLNMKGSPSIYQLQLDERLVGKESGHKIRKCELGKPADGSTEKVIMMVGATGAGKTTLINGMVNYVLGVHWRDSVRFKLIVDQEEEKIKNQAKSQTQWITSYTIHHQEGYQVPYTLTVIDTPGFGDTSGIKRDKEITEQIRSFFSTKGENGIDHLDAIGFVAQSALPRLTPTQQFIFDSILALFGKDIAENIFLLITFADGQKPPVLAGIKEANLPFKKYFKFNNSALFARNGTFTRTVDDNEDEDDTRFGEMFWDMGENSFKTFFQNLQQTKSKSLQLTQDVLNERHCLEAHIIGIQQQIKTGMNKLEQLKLEVNVLKEHEAEIDRNKDFTYVVEEEATKTVNLEPGTYVTNCVQCNSTCHYPCAIPNDEHKRGCAAINQADGTCIICTGNCPWDLHKNMTYKFDIERVSKTKTAFDLQNRYQEAEGKKLTAEQLVQKVAEEFEAVQLKVLYLIDEVRKSIDRLKEIALKPNPLSHVEYIDLLIGSEKNQCCPGWKERVEQLQDVRNQAETMAKITKKGFDPFKEYKKKVAEEKKQKGAEKAWGTAAKYMKKFFQD